VVNARREDWVRDPFKFIEEDGYFYGRGVADMKALASIWIDTLIRYKTESYRPKRTIKLALTCGEESGARMNGVQWLAENRPALIAAGFALNEGGGGDTDGHGKLVSQSMQIGEKSNRSFELEATNPGGHSSIPVDDNAIYELSDALVRVRGHKFPVRFNDTTRTFFAKAGAARSDALGAAMVQLAANPQDKAAEAIVSTDRALNSMLRTTCVATMLEGGHASNALPQRAKAIINCRIVPGEDADTTRAALVGAIGDAKAVPALTHGVFAGNDRAENWLAIVEARLAAVGQIKDKASVDALIDLLGKVPTTGGRRATGGGRGGGGRVQRLVENPLRKLTRENHADADAWRDWWKTARAKFTF
jgi:acetylornithine deacetylase/succinyl-diaminopimelate desuccinylase-like protein